MGSFGRSHFLTVLCKIIMQTEWLRYCLVSSAMTVNVTFV